MSRQDECTKTCVCCHSIDSVRRALVRSEAQREAAESNYSALRREHSVFVRAAVTAFEESMAILRAAINTEPTEGATDKTVECPQCHAQTTMVLDGTCYLCAQKAVTSRERAEDIPALLKDAEAEHVEMHSRTLSCFCEVRECRIATHLARLYYAFRQATAALDGKEADHV